MSTTPNTSPPQGIPFHAEYRFGELDSVEFAAANGRPAQRVWRVAHTVEVGSRSYTLSERLPTDPPPSWAQPFPKGTAVVVTIDPSPAEAIVAGRDGKQRVAKGLFRLTVTGIRPAK